MIEEELNKLKEDIAALNEKIDTLHQAYEKLGEVYNNLRDVTSAHFATILQASYVLWTRYVDTLKTEEGKRFVADIFGIPEQCRHRTEDPQEIKKALEEFLFQRSLKKEPEGSN
jgi:uncharacterized coiled-coil DUF342 family protein